MLRLTYGCIDTIVFPFLIGRIRTEFETPLMRKNPEFPFLIGRIRTKYAIKSFYVSDEYVSIPHR